MMKHETPTHGGGTERASASLPLLFTYKSSIFGKGFIADIELCGRFLGEIEADGIWVYGVNPGAFAIGAETFAAAGPATTKELSTYFADLAERTASFDDFAAEVKRFYNETDDAVTAEWTAAVAAVRSGALCGPAGLPAKSADAAVFGVKITPRASVMPSDNPSAEQRKQPALGLAA
jgi:hypothetical protein